MPHFLFLELLFKSRTDPLILADFFLYVSLVYFLGDYFNFTF